MTPDTSDLEPARSRLSDFLRSRQEQIIADWTQRVRSLSPGGSTIQWINPSLVTGDHDSDAVFDRHKDWALPVDQMWVRSLHDYLLSGSVNMLLLVFLLLALWFFGLVTSYTLGGLLHILLVMAVVFFLVHIIQGRSIGEA